MISGLPACSPAFEEMSANGAEETFLKTNAAFKKGAYQNAIQGYRSLLRAGHINGHVYYNLGNAWFRLNEPGRAILNYERARRLMPRDPDLKFNLSYARDQVTDDIPEHKGIIGMTFFWLDSLSFSELFYAFAVINLLLWTLLAIRLCFRADWITYALITVSVFWIIFGVSFGLKWHQIKTDDRAVILKKEVSVLAGPDHKDTILFKLHAGAVVRYERSEDGWSLINISEKKRGWLKSGELGRVIDES
jgi:tetratricopeptide (TPR) repeat protein